jgi:GH25 family lysozyme M1 (1,4-beta-N-acetylmuramidase)
VREGDARAGTQEEAPPRPKPQPTPEPTPAPTTTLRGFDVSDVQGDIDFGKAQASGSRTASEAAPPRRRWRSS